MEILLQVVLLAVGFVMLVKGADYFVDGVAGIASKFGIPQIVIGLTIVAFGTSAPEAAVSITAAFKGSAEITIGNIVGSNILNILIILGLTSVIVPLHVKKNTARYEMPYVIFVSVLLSVLGLVDGTVGLVDGIILWIGMLLFLWYLLRLTKSGEEQEEEIHIEDKKGWQLLLMVVGGLAVIIWGSAITVDSATRMAEMFGVSDRVIGLTIVALGTSLPELVTSVTAGLKGNADIAVGNIVGSNIFNILFVVGTTSIITPVIYAESFLVDSIVCIAAAVLLWLLSVRSKRLGRLGGIFMILYYGAYLVYLLA